MRDNQSEKPRKNMRVICITGGKGGIGKTTISVNLSIAFAMQKHRVLLFDADLGLANVDVRLGITPKKTLHDFFQGRCELSEVCVAGPHGLKVIPSASGIQKMAELSAVESTELIRSFSTLAEDVDMMVVDMAPGISNQVIDFTHASQDIIVVICNDPASLMDSYAIIKILNQKYGRDKFGVLVNKVKSMQEGYDVFSRFQDAIARFIPVNMNYIGHVPQDDYITLSSRMGGSILDQFPHSEAAKAFRQICHGITHWQSQDTTTGGIQFFFERLIQNRPGTKEPTCIA